MFNSFLVSLSHCGWWHCLYVYINYYHRSRVLRDYHSEVLDLQADAGLDVGLLAAEREKAAAADEGVWRESQVFRDLSKPMGAITEVRTALLCRVCD